jgi:hypothetical protein
MRARSMLYVSQSSDERGIIMEFGRIGDGCSTVEWT